MRRSQLILPVVFVLLVGSACSGSDAPGNATAPPSATPSAPPSSAPATTTRPALNAGKLSAWKDCEGSFQCAKLIVALDPAKPELGSVDLALTKRAATGSGRIGSLVVNPGGPGASAVEFLQRGYSDMPSTIRQRFDLVAFDPRGVGRSSPVRCLSTAELDSYFHIDPVPDNDAELQAIGAGNRKLIQGCQAKSGEVLPYVSTSIVVDDLERVRIAVGDDKLTYLGYSYGTAIGAGYLDRYPTHIRAMVLDGAIDPSLTWDQLLAGQAKGFEGALEAFLADCQKTRCEFREAVKGDLHDAFDAIARRVETKPLPGKGKRTVGPGEFSYGVGAGLYNRAFGWPAIANGLASASKGDGETLLALNDSYLERGDDGYKNISEANTSVNCIDRPWPRTNAPYLALAERMAKLYPRFGPHIALSGLGCSVWPIPPVGTPHKIVAAASPPVIVIGTTRDPATPYSWAQALAGQLAHGVLLSYNGDGHTVYRSGAPRCILRPVNSYLVDLTVPKATTC